MFVVCVFSLPSAAQTNKLKHTYDPHYLQLAEQHLKNYKYDASPNFVDGRQTTTWVLF